MGDRAALRVGSRAQHVDDAPAGRRDLLAGHGPAVGTPGGYAQFEGLDGHEEFDADDGFDVGHDLAQVTAGVVGHRDVVLLVRRCRDRIDGIRVCKGLAVGDEGRGQILRQHEPAVHADLLGVDEHVGQAAVQRPVVEAEDPPFGDVADLGDRDREEVGGEGDVFGVEVSAGDGLEWARQLREDERVVGCGVEFAFDDPDGEVERVGDRAEHLWHTAQRVRILRRLPVRVGSPAAGDELRVGHELPHPGGDGDLAGLPAYGVQLVDERITEAQQRLDRHRRGHLRGLQQGRRIPGRERGLSKGERRAIQQCEAVLGADRHPVDARCRHRLGAGHDLPVKHCLTGILGLVLPGRRAGEDKGDVGQRDQVSGGTERTVFGHRWPHVVIQHRDEPLDERPGDRRMPGDERLDADEHRGPHDFFVDEPADA